MHLLALYEGSFPAAERRSASKLVSMAGSEKRMNFCAIADDDGAAAGLLVYWDFPAFTYVEHLAVFPQMRNGGIGQRLIEHLSEKVHKTLILEAEPPETPLACRRIAFYQRNGFEVADRHYRQPPYAKGGEEVPMWLLASGETGSQEAEDTARTIKEEVYAKHW